MLRSSLGQQGSDLGYTYLGQSLQPRLSRSLFQAVPNPCHGLGLHRARMERAIDCARVSWRQGRWDDGEAIPRPGSQKGPLQVVGRGEAETRWTREDSCDNQPKNKVEKRSEFEDWRIQPSSYSIYTQIQSESYLQLMSHRAMYRMERWSWVVVEPSGAYVAQPRIDEDNP
ncbi:unnamed protein product [Mycena citricolor]|uniref:Uncharacterized protein n=1 Tax=Mycena citricolor TaxID=2018698 RepID=A0AAD2Q6R8_9AGAR|nr:unnamed protein product [Mycena citricolor]